MMTRTFGRASAVALAIFTGSLITAYAQEAANLAITGNNMATDVAEEVFDEAVIAQEAFVQTGQIPVMVELQEASAVTVLEEVTAVEGRAIGLSKAKGQAKKLDLDQQALLGKLKEKSSNGSVTYRLQRSMNAVAMVVDPSDVLALASLPEVKAIYPIVEHYPDAASSNPTLRVEAFWNSLPSGLNVRGTGIKVGVIDSGTDYLHTAFGGPGMTSAEAGVTDANANGHFPNAKFPGGWDFAGDAYTGSATPPVPDANPMDTNGHGTAVASLIAGRGTNGDGTTYTGPFDSTTDYAPLRTSPGVAPDALIYPLRVFGTTGSTGLTHLAIEWAMDPNGDGDMSDRLDVINLSLGAANGHYDDVSAITANAASKAGVVVVISAGNNYNINYITGSPAVADGAISVAASFNSQAIQAFRVISPADIAGLYGMIPAAFGPLFPFAGITSDLVLADPLLGNGDVTLPLINAAAVAGKIVVMERGAFGFTSKVRNAQNSGAVGVIMLNNAAGPAITMGGTDPLITIPSAMISQADGALLKARLPAIPVSANASSQNGGGADTMAGYSSRGPRRGDSMLKPDITAPAELVSAALVNSRNANTTFNGTSSAAPHMAGGMALMRQANPGWTSEELKALAMNTASFDLFSGNFGTGPNWSLSRVGAGRTDLQSAARSKVIAFNKDRPDLVSISYGQVEAAKKLNLVRHVSVRNKSNAKATYTISWQPNLNLPGVSIEFDNRKAISVPAGVTNHFPIKLLVDPSMLKNVRDPLIPATERVSTNPSAANQPRHFLNEFAGHVVLTPTSGGAPAIRVPVWAAVRPAGRMSAAGASIVMDAATGSTSVPVSGTEVDTGTTYPLDITGLVKGYELQYEGTANPAAAGYLAGADIQYAGVTSDFRTRGNTFTNSLLNFGVSMFGNWDTPSLHGVETQIQIDNNNDDVADYTVFTRGPADLDTGTSNSTSNVYVTYFTKHFAPGAGTFFFAGLPVNGLTPATINTYAMNNSVVSISVPAANVGVTATTPDFRYKVRGLWRGVLVSETGWNAYNPSTAGLDTAGASVEPVWHLDVNGNSVPVTWNRANYQARGSLGMLLIHLHNVAGMRSEKVPVVIAP